MEQDCKHCGSMETIKNGYQKGYQNYLCKSCGRNFVPPREDKGYEAKKQLAVILYGSGGVSYNYLSRLFSVCPATVMNWVRSYASGIEEPVVSADIKEIELDEMRHFIGEKKVNCGSLKPLIDLAEKRLHGLRADGTRKPLNDFMKK